MAVLSQEDLLKKLKERFSEDTSDEALSFIEDVKDTVADLETKSKDTTDWKQKYADNDKAWREKYKARFFETPAKSNGNDNPDGGDNDDGDGHKPLTYDQLFSETKGK